MNWIEITKDNEAEVYHLPEERLVILNTNVEYNGIHMYGDILPSICTMAKCGGYYYIVLPELLKGGDQ